MSPYSGLNPILSQLRDHLGFRRMECGMQTLSAHASAFASLDAAQPNAGVLLGLIAQWVDAGFAGPELVKTCSSAFPTSIAPTCRFSTTCMYASPKEWSPWPRKIFRWPPNTSVSSNPWKARSTMANSSPSPISGPPAACAAWAATMTPSASRQRQAAGARFRLRADGRHHASAGKLAGLPEGKTQ